MGLFGGPNVEKLTAKKDVEGLIKALVHNDEAVRRAAAEALGDIKDFRAVVPLVAALRGGASSVGMAVAEALGKIGDPRAVEPLAAAPRAIRIHAIQALIPLSRWGGTRATEELISALSDVDPVVPTWTPSCGLLRVKHLGKSALRLPSRSWRRWGTAISTSGQQPPLW